MEAHVQAKAVYNTAKNALITAVLTGDKAAVKEAYVARKRAMASRVTLVHQEKALAKQSKK